MFAIIADKHFSITIFTQMNVNFTMRDIVLNIFFFQDTLAQTSFLLEDMLSIDLPFSLDSSSVLVPLGLSRK